MKLNLILVLLAFTVFGCNSYILKTEMRKSSEEQLIRYLITSTDSELKLAAAEELKGRTNYTLQGLSEAVKALDDPNPLIRENLLYYMGNTGYKPLDSVMLNKLNAILLNDVPEVSTIAAKVIAKLGDLRSVPALNDAIRSRDDDGIRLEAIRAIILLGGSGQSVSSLVFVIDVENDLATKQQAIEALADAKQDALCAIPILAGYLEYEDIYIRMATAKAIAEISGDDFEINNILNENGNPKIVDAVKSWWNTSGQYKSYQTCDIISSMP